MQIKRVPVASLKFWPQNARMHGPENDAAIKASLLRFGQAEPLVVQASTQQVIGGNGRLAAMRKLAWNECDIVELEIDDRKATALGLALNRTAELATWNEPVLAEILKSLDAQQALDGVGFSHEDLDALLDELQAQNGTDADLDQVPEPPDQPVTRHGDLWILGPREHRLLCGDSASVGDLDRLLAGAPIHLVNTDPPYNVRVEPRSNNAIAAGLSSFTTTHHQKLDVERHPEKARPTTKQMRAKDRPLTNDFMKDEDFAELLGKWFGNIGRVLLPGRGFYIWGGYSNCGNYPPALRVAGLYFSQAIIWDKGHPVLTRKDYMGAHEWCFYGWKEGAAHEFFGPNNATDLWEVKKVSPQSMVHLTEKPVELATRAILYSSRRGENVLDLFGGSGSTLVGCEQTERRGFLMELDEPYCDVILTRYRDLFHDEPRLEGTGQTYAEVAVERGVDLGLPAQVSRGGALAVMRRLPPDAFAYYLSLGVGRSYQAVADHFEVTKTAVVNLAVRENWAEKLVQVEKRVGEAAAKKAEESIAQMNDRHLRSLKAVQGKALETLRSRQLDTAMDAVRALDLAIRQERVIRGEPGDRASIEVGDVIKREYERWLTPADEAASPAAPSLEEAPADAPAPAPADATEPSSDG